MRLTQNEKRILKILLENSKISDTIIANNLNITSQAVGRIRKKLEKEVINSYTLHLNFFKIGVGVFFIGKMRLTSEGIEFGKCKVEEKLIKNPYFFAIYEVLGENFSYIFAAAFKEINELHDFFNSKKNHNDFLKYVQIIDTFSIPIKGALKHDINPLLKQIINEKETKGNKKE